MAATDDPLPPGDGRARDGTSLADTLRTFDDAALSALLRARPDLIRPLPDDIADLAARAASPYSVRLAWDRLNRLQQQVLEVLVALGRPITSSDLHSAMGTDDPAVRAALASLRSAALVWGPLDAVRPVSAAAELLGPTPCGLDPVDRTNRPAVARCLTEPDAVRAEIAAAPPAVRELLDRLLWSPYGSVAAADRVVTQDSARTPIEWLLARSLLLPEGPRSVVLPREVALLLRDGRYVPEAALPPPPPVLAQADPVPDADATGGLQALTSTRAAARLLGLVADGDVRRLRTGGVYQRDGVELARRLHLAPTDTAVLADAAWTAGLVAGDEVGGRWGVTGAFDAWRALPEPRAWAVLVLAWLQSPRHVGGQDPRLLTEDLALPGIAEVRRLVLQSAVTSLDAPVDPAGLAAHVRWHRPRWQREAVDRIVTEVLAQAEQLGLLGRGAITAAGRAAAADAPEAAALEGAVRWPDLVEELLFQADLTATSFGPLTLEAQARIERIGDLESTGTGAVYRIAASSLERAFDDGLAQAEVLAEITALSATPVPASLTTLVSDVARRHGAIVVHAAASVITSQDDAALSAAAVDRSLAGLRLRRLAPGVLISTEPLAEVVAALRRAGIPAVDAQGPQRRRPARVPAHPPVVAEQVAEEWVSAAVRAVRSGEQARVALAGVDRTERVGPHELLDRVGAAIRDATLLWIDVVDATGQRRVRLVEPLTLRAGMLSAYDHREQRVMGFPLSRIAGLTAAQDQ